MVRNGPKLFKMVENGTNSGKCFKIIQNYTKQSQIIPKWSKKILNGLE